MPELLDLNIYTLLTRKEHRCDVPSFFNFKGIFKMLKIKIFGFKIKNLLQGLIIHLQASTPIP